MESYNAFPPTNDIDIQSEKNTIVLLCDSYPMHFLNLIDLNLIDFRRFHVILLKCPIEFYRRLTTMIKQEKLKIKFGDH